MDSSDLEKQARMIGAFCDERNAKADMPLSVRAEELRRRFNRLMTVHTFKKGDLVIAKEGIGNKHSWGRYCIVTETDVSVIKDRIEEIKSTTVGRPLFTQNLIIGAIDPSGEFCEFAVDRAHYEPWKPSVPGEDA